MSYPSSYYTQAQGVIDRRRNHNNSIYISRYNEIKQKYPEITDIIDKLSQTTEKLARIILAKPDNIKEQIEQLKNENLALQQSLADMLTKNGYPKDYLDEIYTCKKCGDTGNNEDGRCECFINELRRIAAENLSQSLPMGLTCFESFNLSYYSDSPMTELKGLSPRAIMERNYKICLSYADDFRVPYESLFMTGGTGLGKTHLSLSIAKRVVEKEYSVVYGSVPDLLRKIENAHFNKSEEDCEVLATLKSCDLLVLDDLGAEFDSQFYVSCLYEIINTRVNFGRPTVVSTNMTLNELQNRYTDRIVSRLLSMRRLVFCGEDIRIKLKTKNNSH